MGIGAITVGGCNISHGLTGIGTTSVASFIAFGSMLVGMRIALW